MRKTTVRVREVRTDEITLMKEDTPTPWLRYVGRSDSMVASDEDAVWQILRVSKENSVTTSEYAKKGSFVCKWADRASYFNPIETTYLAFEADMSQDFISDVAHIGQSQTICITASWANADSQNGEFFIEASGDGANWLEYDDAKHKITLAPNTQIMEFVAVGVSFFRVVYVAGGTLAGQITISFNTKGDKLKIT